jgi:hypothetical protein
MSTPHTVRKEVICAAVAIVMAAWTTSAWAQPIIGGGPVPVTAETPGDFFYLIMESETTPTAESTYQPNTQYISSLDEILFGGVNAQNANELMPVTEPLPCNSYDPMINDIAPALMNTYLGALTVAQQQESEVQSEDFTTIAANIQTPAQLAAIQGVGQATLAVAQELQLLRQAVDTLVVVIATDKLHQLDSVVRSLMPRGQDGGC